MSLELPVAYVQCLKPGKTSRAHSHYLPARHHIPATNKTNRTLSHHTHHPSTSRPSTLRRLFQRASLLPSSFLFPRRFPRPELSVSFSWRTILAAEEASHALLGVLHRLLSQYRALPRSPSGGRFDRETGRPDNPESGGGIKGVRHGNPNGTGSLTYMDPLFNHHEWR